MKNTLFTLLFIFPLVAYGQNKQELIGKWQVYEANYIGEVNEEMKQKMAMLQKALSSSVIHFHDAETFSFSTQIPDFQIEREFWKYNEDRNFVIVNRWNLKDKKTPDLMGLIISKDRMGRVQFQLYETPIVLIAKKI